MMLSKPVSYSKLWFILYFVVLCFILYGNTLFNEYALDDDFVTAGNPVVSKGIKGIPEIFSTLYQNYENFKYEYRPLVKLTYAIEYEFFGKNPAISHFINVLIYLVTNLFLFFLLQKIFKDYHIFFSLLITTVFLAHPIHTEVVASLKNRDELLSFLFSLITLYYSIKLGETRKKIFFIPIVVFFILALLSKQSAMVFAAICPFTIFFVSKNSTPKDLIVLFLVLVFCYITFKLFQRFVISESIKEKFFKDNPLNFVDSFWIKSATGMMILLFYLKILIFPHPLLFYYGYNMIPVTDWADIRVILSFILHLALLIVSFVLLRKRKPLGYGIMFYLICISMFTSIVRPTAGMVAERYAYAASLGFAIVLVSLFFSILKVKNDIPLLKKYLFIAIFSMILIPYSIKTILRNFDWKNHYTLYSADIKYLHNSSKANELYASELMRQVNEDMLKTKDFERNRAKTELAVKHFKRSVEIDSSNYLSNNNLGLIYFVLYRDNAQALKYFKNAIRYKPDYERGNFNLALVYENQNDYDSAIYYYEKVIQIDPKNQHAYINMANIYFDKKNDLNKAIEINQKLMQADPQNALPYITIGGYYLKISDTAKCLEYYEKAAEKPNIEPRFLIALSKLYAANNQPHKAAYYLKRAEKINTTKP